jgi:hypothetical protein
MHFSSCVQFFICFIHFFTVLLIYLSKYLSLPPSIHPSNHFFVGLVIYLNLLLFCSVFPFRCIQLNEEHLLLQDEVIRDVLLADQPTKRFVKPSEIAALVRHLCSDDAISICGACLSIDGGWTAR